MSSQTKQASNFSMFQPEPVPVTASCMLEKTGNGFSLKYMCAQVSGT